MDWLDVARSWALNHLDLIGPAFFVAVVLNAMLPLVLVSMIGHRLPDVQTGFRQSDAFPIMPSAYFRYLAFIFGRRGLELSGPAGRGLIRVIRLLKVTLYVALFSLFFASVTEGYVFDPNSEFLKSDSQKAIEAAGPGADRRN